MGYILIMQFGVFGLIVTTLVAGLPSICLSLLWTKKHYGVSVDWRSSYKNTSLIRHNCDLNIHVDFFFGL